MRNNRRQVDNGGGLTRIMVEMNAKPKEEEIEMDEIQSTAMQGESIEYFYLEDPKIPDEMFPVKVSGVFDRLTIGESIHRRLKDDVIKMLSRTEKFGVKASDTDESNEVERKPEKGAIKQDNNEAKIGE